MTRQIRKGGQYSSVPGDAAYTIGNSVWFDGANDTLTKTFSTPTDNANWAWSWWMKRWDNPATDCWVSAGTSTAYGLYWDGGNNALSMYSTSDNIASPKVQYRDFSGWMHCCLQEVSGVGTLYINGVAVGFTSALTLTDFNTAIQHSLGSWYNTFYWADVYFAEMIFLDGTGTYTDFGEFDANGVWVPKDPAPLEASKGNNGAYLDFSVASAPGTDAWGGTTWTNNGTIATTQQTTDTPTNNQTTQLPIAKSATAVLENGNTRNHPNSSGYFGSVCSHQGNSDLVYMEFKAEGELNFAVGLVDLNTRAISLEMGSGAGNWLILNNGAGTRVTRYNGSDTNSRSADAASDYFQVAFDRANGDVWLGRNDSYFGGGSPSSLTTPTYSSVPSHALFVACGGLGWVEVVNGEDIEGTLPTNFEAVGSSATMSAPAIADPSAHFQNHLYQGDAGTRTETLGGNSSMDPEMVLIKNRDTADEPKIIDIVRGATWEWSPDDFAVQNQDNNGLTAFGTDSFDLGTGANGYNDNLEDFVAACWAMGSSSGVTNTDGDNTTATDTTISANTTAGQVVGTYTGTGSSNTFGHGLDSPPELIMIKAITTTGAFGILQHSGFGNWSKFRYMFAGEAIQTDTNIVPDTAPTSTVFSLGPNGANKNTNAAEDYWFFAAHSVPGYSKIGTYEGNGAADGPFVYCGFRPALIWCFSLDSSSPHHWFDAERLGYNVDNNGFDLISGAAELTTDLVDILSNGFKLRVATDPNVAETYGFYAVAKHPFGGSGVAPATAR